MGLNVATPIIERAHLRPASPAIITRDRVITYGQLGVAIGVVARHLRQAGVAPGQVVGMSMSQNPRHLATMLALAQIGAVSLPLHPMVPQDRRLLAARRYGATSVVSGSPELALPGLPFISLAELSFDGMSPPPDNDTVPVEPDTPFRIAISSGTSGDPKGMMMTHGLMASRNRRREPGFSIGSRVLPMDLNFGIGFCATIRTLASGACVVLPASMGKDALFHAMVAHHVTHVSLSPAQALEMVDMFAVDGIHCPNLACLRLGGGPLMPGLLDKVRRMLTRNVYVIYGSSESGILTYASPEDLERHPDCVGRVLSGAEVEIVDDEDRPLPAGGIGLVRSRYEDQVQGYFRDDVRTRRQFRDGWFYSGDLGRFDQEGLLYFEGRMDEQLNVGGLKVNPEDLDATLLGCAAVADAGTFLHRNEDGKESIAAAVVLQAGTGVADVEAFAAGKLGPLAPRRYFIVTSLPRTITGKLRRAELTRQFSGQPGAR